MESGSIPESKITASSVQSASTPANNSRLNFASGSSWCAGTGDSNPYLQIDLQTLHIICAVSTQGNSQADQWVKNYTLQSSLDGSNWTNYTEIGQVKVMCEMNHCIVSSLYDSDFSTVTCNCLCLHAMFTATCVSNIATCITILQVFMILK